MGILLSLGGIRGSFKERLTYASWRGKHETFLLTSVMKPRGLQKKGRGLHRNYPVLWLSRNTGQGTVFHEQDMVLEVERVGESAWIYLDT